ncbi:MAG: dipeptide epimerase [Myxococcota bacterium]
MAIVSKIEPVPLQVELVDPFVIASTRLDRVDNVAVKLVVRDGTTGWGEVATLHPVTAETYDDALGAVRAAADALCGTGVDRAEALAERLADLGLHGASRCGIEQAWWDAVARETGVPLFRRIAGEGGAPSAVTTDVTLPICAPERARELAAGYRERGFETLKVKVGGELAADLERVLAVLSAHPMAALVLDANEGWSVEQTLEAVRALRERGARIAMLEQPVPRADLEGLARLTREAGTLVAADEACRTLDDVRRIARHRQASAVNVKLAKCGVLEGLQMLREARRHGLATMIGAMVETRLGTGFSAHVAAALGGFAVVDLDTSLLLQRDPITGGPALDGPRWRIDPTVTGHGGGVG